MKNFTLIAIVGCFALFLANTFEKPTTTESPLIITAVGDTPQLPNVPYKYGFRLPDHIVKDFPPNGGYGTGGGIDTTVLPFIGSDVATLGRVLFYDKVLSVKEDISCGSCHIQSKSFADDHALSTGVFTETSRNSMHLNDLGWSNNKHFFWDMRQSSMTGAIQLPLTDANEIGATMDDIKVKLGNSSYYPELFVKAFGSEEVTQSKILKALAEFIISMNSTESRLDKILAGDATFTYDEEKGSEIFAKDCNTCHVQGSNTFLEFLSIKDQATMTFNGYTDEDGDKGVTQNVVNLLPLFKMPSLRNIEVTGPYMHDGGIPTLDSLINFYSQGIEGTETPFLEDGGFEYSDTEKKQLKAFLMTLTDESFLSEDKWSDPFSGPNSTNDLDAEVVISPNPSYDFARIAIDGKDGKRKDVVVTGTNGQTMYQGYFLDDRFEVEVSDYPAGLYVLTLRVGNEMGSYKMMIQ